MSLPDVIVLIDDSPTCVAYTLKTLNELNLINPVIVFNSPYKAITWLSCPINARTVGLLIVDLDMPQMNGFETIETLKTVMDKLPKFIFVTGSCAASDLINAYKLHALEYVRKTPNPEHFKAMLRTALDLIEPNMEVRMRA